jgi:hypothetical protein
VGLFGDGDEREEFVQAALIHDFHAVLGVLREVGHRLRGGRGVRRMGRGEVNVSCVIGDASADVLRIVVLVWVDCEQRAASGGTHGAVHRPRGVLLP